MERFSKKCDNYNDFCECQKIKKESLIYNGFICDKYYSVKFDKKKISLKVLISCVMVI